MLTITPKVKGMSISNALRAFPFKVTSIFSWFVVTSNETHSELDWSLARSYGNGVPCGDGFKSQNRYRSYYLLGRYPGYPTGLNGSTKR